MLGKSVSVLVLCLFAACVSSSATASLQSRLAAAEAKDHIGERATVCGLVASANFATRSRKQPTFLNLDEPYPRHVFTAVIWGDVGVPPAKT